MTKTTQNLTSQDIRTIVSEEIHKDLNNGGGEIIARKVKEQWTKNEVEEDAQKWNKMTSFLQNHWLKFAVLFLVLGQHLDLNLARFIVGMFG